MAKFQNTHLPKILYLSLAKSLIGADADVTPALISIHDAILQFLTTSRSLFELVTEKERIFLVIYHYNLVVDFSGFQ